MASRALLRRKRVITDYLCTSGRSVHFLSYLGHGKVPQSKVSNGNETDREPLYTHTPSRDPWGIAAAEKVEPLCFHSYVPFREECGILTYGPGNGSVALMFPFQKGSFSHAVRYASTAAAKKHEIASDDEENEEVVARQRKEASAEDCDQAVAGLSSAKAKAKAKQVQDSSKAAQTVLQRVWSMLLGIGPALRVVASLSREDWAKKLVHWKSEFMSTLQHYWLGTKLLWADVRISSRLLIKLANGKSLSRRERQQLTRTTADIFRLVPFAVFIIVPFMEFLLPVFLKLFPNMLPSTFQDKMKEQEALKRRLQARIEYARFLQDTVKEMAKEVQNSRSGEIKQTAEDLDEFLNRVRTGARVSNEEILSFAKLFNDELNLDNISSSHKDFNSCLQVRTGAQVSNEEILSFAKLFNDELTLDNINRPRLVNMCKYMGISPFGTDHYLRYMLRKRLQRIKEDDKLIQAEGIESLSEAELREDCRERGMLGILSVEEMRQQLQDWLDLSLNHSVPSSLLILSRSFTVSGKVKPEDAVGATLSSLPDEVVDTVGFKTLPSEDSVSERRRKLEYLAMQEELIKEEEEKEEEEQSRIKEAIGSEEDVALREMMSQTAEEAQELARARALEKHEELCEISRALAVLASASSVSSEREEFLQLVNKEIELYNSVVDREGTHNEKDAMRAYIAAREDSSTSSEVAGHEVSSALIDKVDAMLQNLEREIDNVDAEIGDRWRILDRDHDGKVTPEEVASAALYLKSTLGKEGVQELISNLSKDGDGKILVEDIVRLGSRTDETGAADGFRG